MSVIGILIGFFGILAMAYEFRLSFLMNRAVKGSHERYALSTQRRLMALFSDISFIVMGVLFIMDGALIGIFNIIFAIFDLYLESKKDDDDWFKGRWKKMKKGVKNYVKSLAPSPAPSYNGAGA